MSRLVNGNSHVAHDCPFCWLVLYSRGALTNHINNEHWREAEQLQQDLILAVEEKPEAEFRTAVEDEISLCRECFCMTKTIDGHCGKCKAPKELSDEHA